MLAICLWFAPRNSSCAAPILTMEQPCGPRLHGLAGRPAPPRNFYKAKFEPAVRGAALSRSRNDLRDGSGAQVAGLSAWARRLATCSICSGPRTPVAAIMSASFDVQATSTPSWPNGLANQPQSDEVKHSAGWIGASRSPNAPRTAVTCHPACAERPASEISASATGGGSVSAVLVPGEAGSGGELGDDLPERTVPAPHDWQNAPPAALFHTA